MRSSQSTLGVSVLLRIASRISWRSDPAGTAVTTSCADVAGLEAGDILTIPVAHGEGNYVADDDTLDRLEGEGHVVFRYVNASGEAVPEAAPNGSARNIAGVTNARGNVLGMMPHPERAVESRVGGSTDGARLFRSALSALEVA